MSTYEIISIVISICNLLIALLSLLLRIKKGQNDK